MRFPHVGVVCVGLGAVGALSLAGCSGGTAGSSPPAEKVAMQSAPLIDSNPNPPYAFPGTKLMNPLEPSFDCQGAPRQLVTGAVPNSAAWLWPENYVAFPVKNTCEPNNPTVCDSSVTAYSHSYSWAEQGLSATLASDFFSIPNANAYKYEVALLTQTTITESGRSSPALTLSPKRWYLAGINRADQSWLASPPNTTLPAAGQQPAAQPWCYSPPCAQGTAFFNDASHPPYGSNAKGADWLELWNLAWTYSYTGDPYGPQPPDGPTGPNNAYTSTIESEHHQCAFVYVCPGGTQACNPESPACPSGQACVLDETGTYNCWSSCYYPNAGAGVVEVKASDLVPWDFFPAAERHDPNCCGF